MRATENSVSRTFAAGLAKARAQAQVGEQPCRAPRRAPATSQAGRARPVTAVLDHLRDGADARRDHWQAGEHGLEEDDPKPSQREGRDDVRAVEPSRGSRGGPGGAPRPRGRARRRACASRPRAGHRRGSRAAPPGAWACAREGVQEDRVVSLFDQAADGEQRAATSRDPGLRSAGGTEARRGKLVEAVADGDELARAARPLEEEANGVGDRDEPARARAKADRDGGTARAGSGHRCAATRRADGVTATRSTRRRRACTRCVWSEVGSLGADSADHVPSQTGVRRRAPQRTLR